MKIISDLYSEHAGNLLVSVTSSLSAPGSANCVSDVSDVILCSYTDSVVIACSTLHKIRIV